MAEALNQIPANLTEERFLEAIGEFRDIVGDDNVLVSPEALASYSKFMLPVDIGLYAPAGAITPASVEEIQAILAVCNRFGVPVWPTSTGKNFGFGTSTAATPGQMILDLRRMNRILHVDPVLGTALLEPGVTYQQLKNYLVENDIPLWLAPPAPSAIVSPAGQAMDRGGGYTPYGDNASFICGLEIVLANGEILKTGMGGLPSNDTWQIYKWGYGPYLDGLFTQSNFGVVTKLGTWLMREPPAYKPFVIRYPTDSDLPKIVDTFRPLVGAIIQNSPNVAHAVWEGATQVRRADYFTGTGTIPDEYVEQIKADLNLGAWNMYAALYGATEAHNNLNWKIVQEAVEKSGGSLQTEEDLRDDAIFDYRNKLMRGEMTLYEFGLYNWRGGGGSAWHATIAPALGSVAETIFDRTRSIIAEYGFDYVSEFVITGKPLIQVFDLLYNKTDPAETNRAYQCFGRLVDEFSRLGWGVSRAPTAWMSQVAETYGPVKQDVNVRIKRALDPNGIIAPGKSGIFV